MGDSKLIATPFQRRVHALLEQIPLGYVTTYGNIARALATSPRAVGNALRNNPFAPQVPCHRCIASTGYVNGFNGQLFDRISFRQIKGNVVGKASQSAPRGVKVEAEARVAQKGQATDDVAKKLQRLREEGVHFDSKGMIRDKAQIWDGPWQIEQRL